MATNISDSLSNFYLACCYNEIEQVKKYLSQLSVTHINQRHVNGNTALHGACLYDCTEIVKLLLQKGASPTILNNDKCTPFDLTETTAIKALFKVSTETLETSRFVAPSTQAEWNFASDHAKWYSQYNKSSLASHKITIDQVVSRLLTDKQVQTFKQINEVNQVLEQCQATQDFTYLLKAYTIESDFFRNVNVALAKEDGVIEKEDVMKRWAYIYTASILSYPDLKKYHHQGTTYRGMSITKDDAKQYVQGTTMYNKSFLSTSKDPSVAENFLKKSSEQNKISVICIFHIKTSKIALDIAKWSKYPKEQEVLVLPYTAVKITNVRKVGQTMEIEIKTL